MKSSCAKVLPYRGYGILQASVPGAERFSKHTGSGETFKWTGDFSDKTVVDEDTGCRYGSVVFMDAKAVANKSAVCTDETQYLPDTVTWELNKVMLHCFVLQTTTRSLQAFAAFTANARFADRVVFVFEQQTARTPLQAFTAFKADARFMDVSTGCWRQTRDAPVHFRTDSELKSERTKVQGNSHRDVVAAAGIIQILAAVEADVNLFYDTGSGGGTDAARLKLLHLTLKRDTTVTVGKRAFRRTPCAPAYVNDYRCRLSMVDGLLQTRAGVPERGFQLYLGEN